MVTIHAGCWLIFIIYELYFLHYTRGKLEPVSVYLNYYIINIAYFYLTVTLLNFIFNHRKIRYLLGIIFFLVLAILYLGTKFITGYFLNSPQLAVSSYITTFSKFLPNSLFRLGYFTVLSTFYWAAGHISHFRKQAAAAERQELLALKEKAELEARLAESRYAYLSQQVNPHLLLNSLSFIYGSVSPYSADAANCVMLLSELLQFSLEDTSPDRQILLSEELGQLQRLFAINRLRFNGEQELALEFEGHFEKFRIIPLILFTLTENIFKHGYLRDPGRPGSLRIKVNDAGQLHFYSRNLVKARSGYARRRQLGLQNVRTRLDFAYPDRYSLEISETAEYFELSLNLQL